MDSEILVWGEDRREIVDRLILLLEKQLDCGRDCWMID